MRPYQFKGVMILLIVMMNWGKADLRAQSGNSSASSITVNMNPLHAEPTTEGAVDMFCGQSVTSHDMAYDIMALRQKNAPRPGQIAPDFKLKTADGDRLVSLSELSKSKPVVLILSSWGCDIFRESLSGLQELHTRYSDKAHFVMVYIREVHPKDGFGGSLGRVNDAKTIDERMAHARRCREQLRLPFLFLVDTMMDTVATRWSAWPVRAYVVDTDGRVNFACAQGPWGYRPYRGYQHGTGKRTTIDMEFSPETLEEFLEKRFPKKTLSSTDPVVPSFSGAE